MYLLFKHTCEFFSQIFIWYDCSIVFHFSPKKIPQKKPSLQILKQRDIPMGQKLTCTNLFTVVLSCGGKSSENCTYLVQAATTSLTSPCSYKICPTSSNICRIRFDFTVSNKFKLLSTIYVNERYTILLLINFFICKLFRFFMKIIPE